MLRLLAAIIGRQSDMAVVADAADGQEAAVLWGSDGVVPYWSSHLDGASSELIVRSGHNVISNPEAIREVIRILHQDERSFQPSIDAYTLFPRNRAPVPNKHKAGTQIDLNNG